MILYRPVGEKERLLIAESDYHAFPPRLPEQPIFYPVLNQRYAYEIASRWNVKDPCSGFAGYVTSFFIDDSFISQYEVHTVGRTHHQEYWIPAEELPAFNANIQGRIYVESLDIVGRKLKIEELFTQFGAERNMLSSGPCWTLNGAYFRLDSMAFSDKLYFVIECADTLNDAENNIFEDADPFPFDLEGEELLLEVRQVLYGLI